MGDFNFDPVTGLLDKNIFPSNPDTEDAARMQFMVLFNQLRDYINKSNKVEDKVDLITFGANINKNGRNSLIKDKRGMVVLELSVKYGDGNTNGIANGAVFATLPVGYRPKQKIERPGYVYQTNQGLSVYVSNFRINPDGTICYNVSYPPAIAEAVNMAEIAVVYYV